MRAITCRPAVLAILLLSAGAASAQEADQATRFIPADSLSYTSFDSRRLLTFWASLDRPALAKVLTPVPGTPGKPPPAVSPATLMEGVLPLIAVAAQGRVEVATSGGQAAFSPNPPRLAVVPTGSEEQARTLALALEMQVAGGTGRGQARDYHGVTITTLPPGKLAGSQPSYAVVSGTLLFATQPQWLEKALDTGAGRAPALGTRPDFRKMRDRIEAMGPNDAWSWLDARKMLDGLLGFIEEQSRALAARRSKSAAGRGKGAPPAPPVNVEALRPLFMAVVQSGRRYVFSPTGATTDGFELMDPQSEFGRLLLAEKPGPLRSAGLTSSRAVAYAGTANVQVYLDLARHVFDAVLKGALEQAGSGQLRHPAASFDEAFRKLTGMDLQRDLLSLMGPEVAVVLNHQPAGEKTVPVLIYIKTKDKPALGKAMQRLRLVVAKRGTRIAEKDLPQGRIYTMAADDLPLAPGWTFAGDYLVLGFSPGPLKSPLFLAKGMGTPFSATPAFQQAAASTHGAMTHLLYVDLARLRALSLPMPPTSGKQPALRLPFPSPEALRALGSYWTAGSVEGDYITHRAEWHPATSKAPQ